MTPEQLQQAINLIEKYKGKITEGEWLQVYGERWSWSGLEISFKDKPSISAKIEDIDLMSDAPTLLALLEVAVEENKQLKEIHETEWHERFQRGILGALDSLQEAYSRINKENKDLKTRIAQLEERDE